MSERRRRPNGAAKRYKGPRELVGTRVPPEITDKVDQAIAKVTQGKASAEDALKTAQSEIEGLVK